MFVQGTVWGANSFDIFGVEHGKKLAVGPDVSGSKAPPQYGAAGITTLIE